MTDRPMTFAARLRRLIDLGLLFASGAILLALILRAALSIDTSHDTWWYHLPWAARLSGLMPAHGYIQDELTEQRYLGFPVLVQWLEGQLWRLTGRPEAANFVALGSLVGFAVWLRLRFRAPAALTLLALLAIPLIQIHATSAYTDLPTNLALAVAILLLLPLYSRTSPIRAGDLAVWVLACAAAVHSKPQAIPTVALVLAAGIGALIRGRHSLPGRPTASLARGLAWTLAAALVCAGIFAVQLRNLALYGNPVYPMAMKLGPWTLNGPEGTEVRHDTHLRALLAARARESAPPVEAKHGAPRPPAPPDAAAQPVPEQPISASADPLAWARSVLEIGMEPLLGRGQWSIAGVQKPPLPERYGGFFGWYVLFNLVLLAVQIAARPRERAPVLALFLAVTATAALLPGQSMLRYYMFWMIVLVCLNLLLLRPAQSPGPAGALSGGQRTLGLAALGAFLIAVYATGAEYVRPRFYFLEDLIAARRDPHLLAEVASHPATCLAGELAPRMFLYAPLFNPGLAYRLKMGPVAGEPRARIDAACGPGWTPVIAERADAGLLPGHSAR